MADGISNFLSSKLDTRAGISIHDTNRAASLDFYSQASFDRLLTCVCILSSELNANGGRFRVTEVIARNECDWSYTYIRYISQR